VDQAEKTSTRELKVAQKHMNLACRRF